MLCVVNSVVLTENLALNRPSYQTSVYSDRQGPYSANLANDGSRHIFAHNGTRCAISGIETNPWWAVNLRHPATIYRVALTNGVVTDRCLAIHACSLTEWCLGRRVGA